ncbi:MAG TPA: LytTR family DNA-binding domain-containing protein [Croceibacterium sp.]
MTSRAPAFSFPGSTTARALGWVGVAVAAGLVLAALGPFGTYMNDGVVKRAGYWVAATLLGVLLYGAALRVAEAAAPPGSWQRWPLIVGAALIATVPETAATRAGAFWLWPDLARSELPLAVWFAQTATIGLVATLVLALVTGRSASSNMRADSAALSVEPAETVLGSDVLALQMEDHYVRVHRQAGSDLILMPMTRAIERVESDGLRTHRSWWVARTAVVRVEGDARSMRLHLANGIVAPVARSAVSSLRSAGWIAG